MSLVAQPEENQLERAQVSEQEGKVAPKRERLALKSPSAREGMEEPRKFHPVTPQTAAKDISHVDQRVAFSHAEVGMDLGTTQVAARYFVKRAMVWQLRRTIMRSTYKGRSYPMI